MLRVRPVKRGCVMHVTLRKHRRQEGCDLEACESGHVCASQTCGSRDVWPWRCVGLGVCGGSQDIWSVREHRKQTAYMYTLERYGTKPDVVVQWMSAGICVRGFWGWVVKEHSWRLPPVCHLHDCHLLACCCRHACMHARATRVLQHLAV